MRLLQSPETRNLASALLIAGCVGLFCLGLQEAGLSTNSDADKDGGKALRRIDRTAVEMDDVGLSFVGGDRKLKNGGIPAAKKKKRKKKKSKTKKSNKKKSNKKKKKKKKKTGKDPPGKPPWAGKTNSTTTAGDGSTTDNVFTTGNHHTSRKGKNRALETTETEQTPPLGPSSPNQSRRRAEEYPIEQADLNADQLHAEEASLDQVESESDVCDIFYEPGWGVSLERRRLCQEYASQPLLAPDCSKRMKVVPRIFHTVGRESHESYHQAATAAANPNFTRNHHSDESAKEYVRNMCGQDAADAYSCFIAPAFRADLFRFCAMYAEGGVYLDGDIMPLVPLDHMYSECSAATVGHDFPHNGNQGKQMKILAGAPGAPIFKCALDTIINHVTTRYIPDMDLKVSGPGMLHGCYKQHPEDVAITYHDTRNARWPFYGLRAGETILAYEMPGAKNFKNFKGERDDTDYAYLFEQKKIYSETCPLGTSP